MSETVSVTYRTRHGVVMLKTLSPQDARAELCRLYDRRIKARAWWNDSQKPFGEVGQTPDNKWIYCDEYAA